MIKIAKTKLSDKNVVFYCNDIPNVNEFGFPLCVLMWNIINYFPNLRLINNIFSEISKRMVKGGLIMFDMWNGVAAIRDPPATAVIRMELGNMKIIHTLESKTDLMEQKTSILNTIEVIENNKLIDSFSETVIHYLWTLKDVKDTFESNGIEILKVVKSRNWEEDANEKDWKIFIIARKR